MSENKNYLVQSNELIEGFKNEMKDIGELKAFYTLCAMFYHDRYVDPETMETKVNVKSLLECMGYVPDGKNPLTYINHLRKLRNDAYFTAQDEKYKDNFEFLPCFTISVPKAWADNIPTVRQDITVKWNERFVPFITNQYDENGKPIGNYTLLLLQSLVPLRSPAAQELYIQMSKIAGLNYPVKKTVDDMRNMLSLTTPYYSETKNVTRKLSKYIDEINKNTNIQISMRFIPDEKDKRKTVGYSFKVHSKDVKSNIYFNGCPDVYITQQDYINLTADKQGSEIALLKRKANELQELIKPTKEGHTPRPIRNHYAWLKSAVQNEMVDKEAEERQQSKLSVRLSRPDRLKRKPSYDIDDIKQRAIRGDDLEKFFNELEAQEVE